MMVSKGAASRLFVIILVSGALFGFVLSSCQSSYPSSGLNTPALSEPSTATSNTATSIVSSESKLPLHITGTPMHLPTVSLAPTQEVSQDSTQSKEYTQYSLVVDFDYQHHHLAVSQTITYVNHSSAILTELLLVIEANRQAGVFRLKGLNWANGQPITSYTLNTARLQLTLPTPLLPEEEFILSISFELDLPSRAGVLGYTVHQTNLGDWYPYIPPYRPSFGWLVRDPALVGEHLAYDVADYQVDINVPNIPANFVIAANAPQLANRNRYQYYLKAARNFVWSASSEYQASVQTVNGVTIVSYVFPDHQAAGQAALEATSQAISLYSGIFGAYPHNYLAILEANFADGMEYDGLYFLGQEYYAAYAGDPQSYLTALAAHETAHQWWYGMVGNDQATEPWLDESLCTYSELLFYEKMYPDLVDWWWNYRVNRFNPTGWVNSTIYDYESFRPYVNAIYLRGALFLQDLRDLIGDESFLHFLFDYAAHNAHKQVIAEDFFGLLSEYSSVSLDKLKQHYFQ